MRRSPPGSALPSPTWAFRGRFALRRLFHARSAGRRPSTRRGRAAHSQNLRRVIPTSLINELNLRARDRRQPFLSHPADEPVHASQDRPLRAACPPRVACSPPADPGHRRPLRTGPIFCLILSLMACTRCLAGGKYHAAVARYAILARLVRRLLGLRHPPPATRADDFAMFTAPHSQPRSSDPAAPVAWLRHYLRPPWPPLSGLSDPVAHVGTD